MSTSRASGMTYAPGLTHAAKALSAYCSRSRSGSGVSLGGISARAGFSGCACTTLTDGERLGCGRGGCTKLAMMWAARSRAAVFAAAFRARFASGVSFGMATGYARAKGGAAGMRKPSGRVAARGVSAVGQAAPGSCAARALHSGRSLFTCLRP